MFLHHIDGTVTVKTPTYVVLDSCGIGYRIKIPISTYEQIRGEKERLLITVLPKYEIIELFGFYTDEEQIYFESLIKVRGIGGETALRILSSIRFNQFRDIIDKGDVSSLAGVKGIGRKRAEKIIFEMKGLFKEEELPEDAVSALITLGFTRGEARKAISVAKKSHPTGDAETLIKKALKG